MGKELNQVLIKDSKLQKVYLKHKSQENNFENNPKKRPKITSNDGEDSSLSQDEITVETFNEFFENVINSYNNIYFNNKILKCVFMI